MFVSLPQRILVICNSLKKKNILVIDITINKAKKKSVYMMYAILFHILFKTVKID